MEQKEDIQKNENGVDFAVLMSGRILGLVAGIGARKIIEPVIENLIVNESLESNIAVKIASYAIGVMVTVVVAEHFENSIVTSVNTVRDMFGELKNVRENIKNAREEVKRAKEVEKMAVVVDAV